MSSGPDTEESGPLRYTTPYTLDVPALLYPARGDADGSLLVALHGQGMSPEQFADEARACAPDGAVVLLPQAPLPFEIRRGADLRQGNGWYVYRGDGPDFHAWMDRSGEWLLRSISFALDEAHADTSRIDLLGFSQGGYLAGWVGLHHAQHFRRLVVAGARLKHESLGDLPARVAAEHPDFRVLCVHGAEDPSVSPESARLAADAVRVQGIDVAFETFPTRHRVLREQSCQAAVRAFLSG